MENIERDLESDVDSDEEEDIEESQLTPEQAEARRLECKPSLEHLERATTRHLSETIALFDVNKRIIVERRSTLAAGVLKENWDASKDIPWLDTRVYVTRKVDNETGDVIAWDEEGDRWAHLNFKNPNQAIYFAPAYPKNPFKDKRKKKQSKRLRELRERMRDEDD